MHLKRHTVNLINLKRRGTRTRTLSSEQTRLFPSAHAVSVIDAAAGATVQFADVAGTRPGVGTVTTTLEGGKPNTRLTVSLSALKDALSSIGFSLREDVGPDGVLSLFINGLTKRNAATGEVSLIVTHGTIEIVEPWTCEGSQIEKKPSTKCSNTSPRSQTSRTITRR